MEKKKLVLPKIGEFYHFWDDGKTSPSRHYICKCERIITPKEAENIMVSVPDYTNGSTIETSLYQHWFDYEMPEHDWLYATKTDYFIECSCPKYDKNNLWFVRTKDGGWFSMDIESTWQSGRLDVTGEIFDNIIKDAEKYPEYYPESMVKEYKEITY